MERFPNARAYDCFDNDLAGRINGLRLMALVEDIPLKITKTPEGLMVEAKGKSFPVSPDRSAYTQFEPHISVRYRMGQWQPPKDFKDWNDCLLGKRSSSSSDTSTAMAVPLRCPGTDLRNRSQFLGISVSTSSPARERT